MDWNGNLRLPLNISRQESSSFSYLYNYNYDQFGAAAAAGLEMKQQQEHTMLPSLMDKNITIGGNYGHLGDPKKKRLSSEQLESLENSFQEEIKLDPDRKMKLAKELGLQPRQIAVWFQNRRARWKAKQLERLYDALKQEYDAVSRDKQKLQQEVLALRAVLKDQVGMKQISTGYTEVSGEETVESTSIPSSDMPRGTSNTVHQIAADSNYAMNVDGYDQVMMNPAYWAVLPSCP